MNEKQKRIFVLEKKQVRYLKLLAMKENLSMSELIRELIDRDMVENEKLIDSYRELIF
ncbi:hypothetical protein ACJROX_07680 [Pseudalkalibacillus sp. A8]|uniref:hypothetical protein n=1 Tax=Pseudalkalibacillus sp. A8 TaxID=3382641 RepID=UPI0038B66199